MLWSQGRGRCRRGGQGPGQGRDPKRVHRKAGPLLAGANAPGIGVSPRGVGSAAWPFCSVGLGSVSMTCCFPRVVGHMGGVSRAAGWGRWRCPRHGNLSRADLWGGARKMGGRGLSRWVGPVEGVLSGGRYGRFWNEKGLLGPSEPLRSRVGSGSAWRPEKGVWKLTFYPQGGGSRVPLESGCCGGAGGVGRWKEAAWQCRGPSGEARPPGALVSWSVCPVTSPPGVLTSCHRPRPEDTGHSAALLPTGGCREESCERQA